jgi:hypothetical protein
MKTVNSISGGKTSSYLAKHYPADYNLFALVRIEDVKCSPKDKKLVQLVSDKIGMEFIWRLRTDTARRLKRLIYTFFIYQYMKLFSHSKQLRLIKI